MDMILTPFLIWTHVFSYKKGIFNWGYGLARTKLEDGGEEEESLVL